MPIKFLLFFFIMIPSLFGLDQLVVVIAPEINATTGILKRYEKHDGAYVRVGSASSVILGRNGLGWTSDDGKREGDGKSPAGIFPIRAAFGYEPHAIGAMPYLHADEKLICIDDVNDDRYNQITSMDEPKPQSFEWMRREDGVYRYGAVIGYNEERVKGRGSCIFFHLNHSDKRPTSGCTSMEEGDLVVLLKWLDPQKHSRLLQIPEHECGEYQSKFRGIECEFSVRGETAEP